MVFCFVVISRAIQLAMRDNVSIFIVILIITSICMLWAIADGIEYRRRHSTLSQEHASVKESLSMCSASLLQCSDTVNNMSNEEKRRELHSLSSFDVQSWQKRMRTRGWAMPAVYVGDMHDAGIDSRWTSQVGQDRTVIHLFKGNRSGFFVDLAANDAVALSNTLTLEQEYDWSGICMEANPKYFERLYLRKCQLVQAAVGRIDNERASFNFRDEFGGLVGSAFDNKEGSGGYVKTHATVSLEHVFSDLSVPAVIDYMSLDIEGAEEWVFETFPWGEYTILVLTVERPKEKLKQLLLNNGYAYVCDHGDWGDQMWLHSTFPELHVAINSLGLDGSKRCKGLY